jgi:hypothetical protein
MASYPANPFTVSLDTDPGDRTDEAADRRSTLWELSPLAIDAIPFVAGSSYAALQYLADLEPRAIAVYGAELVPAESLRAMFQFMASPKGRPIVSLIGVGLRKVETILNYPWEKVTTSAWRDTDKRFVCRVPGPGWSERLVNFDPSDDSAIAWRIIEREQPSWADAIDDYLVSIQEATSLREELSPENLAKSFHLREIVNAFFFIGLDRKRHVPRAIAPTWHGQARRQASTAYGIDDKPKPPLPVRIYLESSQNDMNDSALNVAGATARAVVPVDGADLRRYADKGNWAHAKRKTIRKADRPGTFIEHPRFDRLRTL